MFRAAARTSGFDSFARCSATTFWRSTSDSESSLSNFTAAMICAVTGRVRIQSAMPPATAIMQTIIKPKMPHLPMRQRFFFVAGAPDVSAG
jgi:hypothetical protein